ncbi:MAG: 30S ribosomal protein S16 [Bacteroidota bacterium]|jgi:small subunit ribosomal protein S16
MVKLRLRRKGRMHHAVYDIIAIDGRKRRDGAFLERLGWFDPNTNPSTISINADKAIHWLNVGAQATPVVNKILSYEGVLLKRHMQFKGKTAEEIAEAIEKHKAVVNERYFRRKELRIKRIENKKIKPEETPAVEATPPQAE